MKKEASDFVKTVKRKDDPRRRGYIKRWKNEKAFKFRKLDNEAHLLEKGVKGWSVGHIRDYSPYNFGSIKEP